MKLVRQTEKETHLGTLIMQSPCRTFENGAWVELRIREKCNGVEYVVHRCAVNIDSDDVYRSYSMYTPHQEQAMEYFMEIYKDRT